MKKFFTLSLVLISVTSYSQQGKFNPFKLIVLKPDTAIIDERLYGDIDSVQSSYINRYYHSIQRMEQVANSKNFPEDDSILKEGQEEIRLELVKAKADEPEVKKFKYYQTLSAYSTEVYNFYFNEYEPFSTIIQLPNQDIGIASLKRLADTSKADYIVYFSNVHTEVKYEQLFLKLTTSLYSRADNKIILTKETEGDSNSEGGMWTCATYLSCLLINGVKTSTNEVASEIAKRQIRH